jgi:hypothetical protein
VSDDLDLRGIDQRHEPDPQFRAALRGRLAGIVAGTDPGSVTEARDLATIELEPTSAKPAPKRNRRRVAKIILAAAAVFAIVLVASREVDDLTSADEPSTTVTVPPTAPPRALPNTARNSARLAPGTYFVDEVDGIPTPRIFATIGDGWYVGDSGWYITKREHLPASQTDPDPLDGLIGQMTFSHPSAVFSDACHSAEGYYRGSVANLDGLVAALTEQQGWAEVTAPRDISIDGYAGKAFQRTAPATVAECDGGWSNSKNDVRRWHQGLGSWVNADYSSSGYGVGSIETLWLLDIDGTVVIISTVVTPGPSAGSPDFAADVLDSIRIERA